MHGVHEGSSQDITLGAEVGAPTGRSGLTKISADTGYQLYGRADGPTPGCSRIVHATIYLAGPVTTSSGGKIAGIDGSAGGDPTTGTPLGGWKISSFEGSGNVLCWH